MENEISRLLRHLLKLNWICLDDGYVYCNHATVFYNRVKSKGDERGGLTGKVYSCDQVHIRFEELGSLYLMDSGIYQDSCFKTLFFFRRKIVN